LHFKKQVFACWRRLAASKRSRFKNECLKGWLARVLVAVLAQRRERVLPGQSPLVLPLLLPAVLRVAGGRWRAA
jgi:hypothetical protein